MKDTIELTEGATPIKNCHYPVSPALQALIYQQIDEMLGLGAIEESESAWSNTITLPSRTSRGS